MAGTYLVAFSAMLFAAASAIALIYTVGHLDAPEVKNPVERVDDRVAV